MIPSTESWWRLPGPSAILQRVASQLEEGRTVILRAPRHLHQALERQLFGAIAEQVDATSLYAREDSSPLHQVAHHCGQARVIPHPGVLVTDAAYQGRTIFIRDLQHGAWQAWRELIDQYGPYAHAASWFDRVRFCAVIPARCAAPAPDEWLHIYGVERLFSPLDSLVFASSLGGGTDDVESQLRARLVAELALWDATLAQRLAALSLAQLSDPLACLVEYARGEGWEIIEDDEEELYDRGLLMQIGGRSQVHSAYAALRSDTRELRRRVWTGQLMTLLPRIEQLRAELLERHGRSLRRRLPLETEAGRLTDVHQLDIGALAYLLPRTADLTPQERERLRHVRTLRNELAHHRPATWDVLRHALRWLE